jgi:hypothetical protein
MTTLKKRDPELEQLVERLREEQQRRRRKPRLQSMDRATDCNRDHNKMSLVGNVSLDREARSSWH